VRRASALHTRHVVRLRRRFETVQLKDSVPVSYSEIKAPEPTLSAFPRVNNTDSNDG